MEQLSLGSIATVVNDIGLIREVKDKLIRHPDPAAENLAAALSELSRIFLVLEEGLTSYLGLSFYSSQAPNERVQERKRLLELESGTVQVQMREAKTHCMKIWNIYYRFLNPWFRRALNDSEQKALWDMFQEMHEFDGHFVEDINSLATWLAQHAEETLDLVDDGNIEEATKRIRQARLHTRTQRKDIVSAISMLLELEADFTELSGDV